MRGVLCRAVPSGILRLSTPLRHQPLLRRVIGRKSRGMIARRGRRKVRIGRRRVVPVPVTRGAPTAVLLHVPTSLCTRVSFGDLRVRVHLTVPRQRVAVPLARARQVTTPRPLTLPGVLARELVHDVRVAHRHAVNLELYRGVGVQLLERVGQGRGLRDAEGRDDAIRIILRLVNARDE